MCRSRSKNKSCDDVALNLPRTSTPPALLSCCLDIEMRAFETCTKFSITQPPINQQISTGNKTSLRSRQISHHGGHFIGMAMTLQGHQAVHGGGKFALGGIHVGVDRARRRAVVAPMPREPPLMKATLPFRCKCESRPRCGRDCQPFKTLSGFRKISRSGTSGCPGIRRWPWPTLPMVPAPRAA